MKKVATKQAYVIKEAFLELMQPIKSHTHTITSDNGKEFAYHEEISEALDTDFFSRAYTSHGNRD